jgi:hypothetical protein
MTSVTASKPSGHRTLLLGLAVFLVVAATVPLVLRSEWAVRHRFEGQLAENGGHWRNGFVRRSDAGWWRAGATLNHPAVGWYLVIMDTPPKDGELHIEVYYPVIDNDHRGITVATFAWKDGKVRRSECLEKSVQLHMHQLAGLAEEFGQALANATR